MKPSTTLTIVPVPTLLTVKQACESMQISRTLLYGMIKVGTIRSVPIGSRGIRIPGSEITRYVQEHVSA